MARFAGLERDPRRGAKPLALPVWTLILAGGQVLPLILLVMAPTWMAALALACGIGFRLILAARFDQPIVSALLHPVGVACLLILQWAALLRAATGRKATWRGRAYTAQS
jgi:hypothetical protein